MSFYKSKGTEMEELPHVHVDQGAPILATLLFVNEPDSRLNGIKRVLPGPLMFLKVCESSCDKVWVPVHTGIPVSPLPLLHRQKGAILQ